MLDLWTVCSAGSLGEAGLFSDVLFKGDMKHINLPHGACPGPFCLILITFTSTKLCLRCVQHSSTSHALWITLPGSFRKVFFQTVLTSVPDDLCRSIWVPLQRKLRKRAGVSVSFNVAASSTANPRSFPDSCLRVWFVFGRSLKLPRQWIQPVIPGLREPLSRHFAPPPVEVVPWNLRPSHPVPGPVLIRLTRINT